MVHRHPFCAALQPCHLEIGVRCNSKVPIQWFDGRSVLGEIVKRPNKLSSRCRCYGRRPLCGNATSTSARCPTCGGREDGNGRDCCEGTIIAGADSEPAIIMTPFLWE